MSSFSPSSKGESRLEVIIGASPPSRLDKALARDVPDEAALSRSRLARLIGDGAVFRDGVAITDIRARVAEGEVYTLVLAAPVETHLTPEAIPLTVLYEDEAVIVVDKPVGMVVHPAPGTPSGTLVNALLHHCGPDLFDVGGAARPGIVHRIDKDTSGLLVAAKTDQAHHGLSAQFADHSVERVYQALVYGVPNVGDPRLRGVRGVGFEPGGVIRVTTQLARHRTDRQRQAVMFEGGRHAVTRLRVVEAFGDAAAQIACQLETGRTHQIRVHLAHLGHGLIGDPVYGGRRALSPNAVGEAGVAAARGFARQALHAGVLGFSHPISGADMRFEVPWPADMAALQGALRGGR